MKKLSIKSRENLFGFLTVAMFLITGVYQYFSEISNTKIIGIFSSITCLVSLFFWVRVLDEKKYLVLKTLKKYLFDNEIENIKEIIDSGISVESISKKFSPDRAKDFQEILYRERYSLKLIKNKNSLDFFVACSKYYENSIKNRVSFSMDSLTPEGMCDLKSWGPLQYPYP